MKLIQPRAQNKLIEVLTESAEEEEIFKYLNKLLMVSMYDDDEEKEPK